MQLIIDDYCVVVINIYAYILLFDIDSCLGDFFSFFYRDSNPFFYFTVLKGLIGSVCTLSL